MSNPAAAARMRAARDARRAEEVAAVARTVGLSDLEDLVLHVERLHPRGTSAVRAADLRSEIVAWATERFAPGARA